MRLGKPTIVLWSDILRRDTVRLIQQLWYVRRARAAGVPEKHVERIRRHFGPWRYAMRNEMRQLVEDMRAR